MLLEIVLNCLCGDRESPGISHEERRDDDDDNDDDERLSQCNNL